MRRSRTVARTMGRASAAAGLVALALAGAAPASALAPAPGALPAGTRMLAPTDVRASADTSGSLDDARGDVDTSNGFFVAPDLVSLGVAFSDNGIGRVDDDQIVMLALVDASPDPNDEIDDELFTGDNVSWWINADNNTATGASLRGKPIGADQLVEIQGTANGVPSVALHSTWNPATRSFQVVDQFPIVKLGKAFAWTAPTSALGIQRGRQIGLQLWSFHMSGSTIQDEDFLPDAGTAIGFQIPGNPAPPTADTGAATTTSPTMLTVAGTVNPLGAPTTYYVRYGVASVNEARTPDVSAGQGETPQSVSVTIPNLRFSTTYQYQIVAKSQWGETAGPVRTARTGDAVAATFQVTTAEARNMRTTGGLLTGTLAPQGLGATYYFEWGPTPKLGNRTPRATLPAQNGTVAVGQPVRRLKPGTKYWFRLVVETDGQTIRAATRSFVTRQPDRLLLSARAPLACRFDLGYCNVTSLFTVVVRLRDGGSGRTGAIPGGGAGTRLRVNCVSGCGVHGSIRLRGRSLLSANAAGLFRGVRLRAGSVIEVRATRRGAVGAVFRVTLNRRLIKSQQSCEISAAGRPVRCIGT